MVCVYVFNYYAFHDIQAATPRRGDDCEKDEVYFVLLFETF